jgi:hypothetical protein
MLVRRGFFVETIKTKKKEKNLAERTQEVDSYQLQA